MQINVIGRHIEITPAIKDFVIDKMSPLSKRYHHINQVSVVLHVENVTHIAEATVHLNGMEIHATAKNDDMYAAIEMLADKLLTQVTKHKEKTIDQHR